MISEVCAGKLISVAHLCSPMSFDVSISYPRLILAVTCNTLTISDPISYCLWLWIYFVTSNCVTLLDT